MPDDETTSIKIGGIPRRPEAGELDIPGDGAEPVGRAVAGMLRHLMRVLDREDRLESGTGDWLEGLRAGGGAGAAAVRQGVLRAVRIASDSTNFVILTELTHAESLTRTALADRLGIPELSVSERVGDLVSAGLAVKVSEANQIVATAAGRALTEWVQRAVVAGAASLDEGLR